MVRFRSAYILKREAAAQAHRLFAGPLVPRSIARPGALPAIPFPSGMRFQAVHSADVGQAYRRALVTEVHGPFNLAAEPVLDAAAVASAMATRTVPVPPRLVRAVVATTWHLRLQPTSPDWVDLLVRPTLLDTRRAREELGWSPAHTAITALAELLEGVAHGAGGETPPLLPLDRAGPAFRP
jgi:UDP-glucose 4-epimerase